MTLLTASTASAIFVSLAALHLYWVSGGSWPSRHPAALATYVLGSNRDRMPPRLLTLAVAVALLAFAWLPLAHPLQLAPRLSPAVQNGALYTVAAIFALRGALGFFEQRIQPSPAHWPYVRLNRVLYSPLCLALAALLYATTT